MTRRAKFPELLAACVATVCSMGVEPTTAESAVAGVSALKSGISPGNGVLNVRYRRRGPVIYLPVGPSYVFYDYPYYYSRGHYPKHIGGYVYYPYYYTGYYPRYGGHCLNGRRHCAAHGNDKDESATRRRAKVHRIY